MKLLALVLLVLIAGPALGETETCLDFECPNDAMDGGKFAVRNCKIVTACLCHAYIFTSVHLITLSINSGGTM